MEPIQLIAADIGNSSTKLAIQQTVEDDRWWGRATVQNSTSIASAMDGNEVQLEEAPAFWSISSVNQTRAAELEAWLTANRPNDKFHAIQPQDIPLASNVPDRGGVGRDRLVAAWMAVQLNDNSGPLIVIDAGTAVTIDLVDETTTFQGGVIYPGATSNLKMLSDSTDALPDLSSEEYFQEAGDLTTDFIGKSTHPAILRGVYQSQIGALKQIVANQKLTHAPTADVYATGGGITPLKSALPKDWQFVSDLVLQGARAIGKQLLAKSS